MGTYIASLPLSCSRIIGHVGSVVNGNDSQDNFHFEVGGNLDRIRLVDFAPSPNSTVLYLSMYAGWSFLSENSSGAEIFCHPTLGTNHPGSRMRIRLRMARFHQVSTRFD